MQFRLFEALKPFLLKAVLALVVSIFCCEHAALAQIGTTKTVNVPLQAWQKRRLERLEILRPSSSDQTQMVRLDRLLTEFEAHPLAQTPIENMEMLGYFYAPREGIQKALSAIVMNATLGWYDALRFGSESGRAEIMNNEAFFKRTFLLAGKQAVDNYFAFAKDHPDQLRSAVEQGLALAEKFKNSDDYDRRWPTAYGLERMICAEGGSCAPLPPKPESEWPSLWEQTKQRVTKYYSVQQ